MIQIISYESKKGILVVGFKVDGFVVYSSIAHDEVKTKKQLLQQAYEQVKQTIDYEKTLPKHSFESDEIGEEFIPEQPKVKTIELSVNESYIQFESNQDSYTLMPIVLCKDQYNDIIEVTPVYTTTLGVIQEDNTIVIPKVEEYTEVIITVSVDNISAKKKIFVQPYEISKEESMKKEIELLKEKDRQKDTIIEEILFSILPNIMGV